MMGGAAATAVTTTTHRLKLRDDRRPLQPHPRRRRGDGQLPGAVLHDDDDRPRRQVTTGKGCAQVTAPIALDVVVGNHEQSELGRRTTGRSSSAADRAVAAGCDDDVGEGCQCQWRGSRTSSNTSSSSIGQGGGTAGR